MGTQEVSHHSSSEFCTCAYCWAPEKKCLAPLAVKDSVPLVLKEEPPPQTRKANAGEEANAYCRCSGNPLQPNNW